MEFLKDPLMLVTFSFMLLQPGLALLQLMLLLSPLYFASLELMLQRLVRFLVQLCKVIIVPCLLLEADLLFYLVLQVELDLFH